MCGGYHHHRKKSATSALMLKVNKDLIVQECDARMFSKEQMPETKKEKFA
jgi:hypothetical protein